MVRQSILGQVISARTRQPLAGLLVEAWDRDLVFDDLLGSAVTDQTGAFTIEFDARHFREILDRRPDICFKVYLGDRLVADTAGHVLWNVRDHTAPVLIPVSGVDSPGPTHEGQDRRAVTGQVTTEDGRAVRGVIAQVLDRGLGAEKPLGKGVTDAKGRYAVHYLASDLGGKAQADIVVRILDPGRQQAEVARSATVYRAGPKLVVNVSVKAGAVTRASEYDRLLAALRPLLGKTALADLDADSIDYLANRSEWDARAVAMAATAAHLSAETRIPPDHHYALLRAGLSGDSTALHRLPADSIKRALKLSIERGVIAADHPIDSTLRIHRRQALEALPGFAPPAAVSTLGEMLDVSLDAAGKARFLEAYQRCAARPTELWSTLAGAGFDTATIERLQTDGKLGHLTRQNAPLVAKLRQVAKISSAEDLPGAGLYKAQAWEALIGDDVPEGLTAQDYAAGLAAQVSLAYPTLVVADMVRRGEVGVDGPSPTGDGEVAAFLRAGHARHKIGVEPVKRWTGYEHLSEAGKSAARVVERLYQLSPSNESMAALFRLGLHSAQQIVREPRQVFMRKHSREFPNETEAMLVYRKARQISDAALSLATMYLTYRSAPDVRAMTGHPEKQSPAFAAAPPMPTLETLFQNMDYCACEHCRSVLGPAAYFVELLEFCNVPQPQSGMNPIDVLSARRPDLQNLLLSCENTNVQLPYVDLVNEILEHYIVHGGLDAAFGHNMREDSQSADLLADPQFVESRAYDATRAQVYPHTLPFDMALAALRLFMQSWRTTLADALRVFGRPDQARRECLGLSAAELSILTGATDRRLPEYFGEPPNATIDAVNAAVANGKTFCRRAAISYEDLVRILKTAFINPGAALLPELLALHLGLGQLQDWYDGVLDDAAIAALLPAGVDREGALGWLRDHRLQIPIVMNLITLTDVSAQPVECNFAEVELRFMRPDADANRLTELAHHKLLRFIRLWRKLGWSIELTDLVLTRFLGMPSSDLTANNLDDAFASLLARVGNFVRLTRRLSISEAQVPEWLAIWDLGQTLEARRETLAHLLRIGATDLAHFSQITGIDPLADDMATDAPSLHRFVDAWGALNATGLKVVDLDYVARHRDDAGTLVPTSAELLRGLKALRDVLTTVDVDLGTAPADADLAYARSKMALVYDLTIVEKFFGLINGNGCYGVQLETVEEALPSALARTDSRLTFNPFAKVLTYAGVMPAAARNALESAADGLGLGDLGVIRDEVGLAAFVVAFTAAVRELFDVGQADLDALGREYPELRVIYDGAAAQPDPTAKARVLLDGVMPTLRPRLKALALRTTLGGLLGLDASLVDALTSGPGVVHSHGDAARGVLDDFLRLDAPVALTSDGTYTLYLDAPATDDYIVHLGVPPGTTVTLTVGEVEVIPATVAGAGGEVRTAGGVRLDAGAPTPAALTLNALPGGSAAELRWRTRSLAKTPIPAARLSSAASIDAARASLIRLGKAALLLRAMPLTPRELQHLAAANGDTAGFLNELDTDGTIAEPELHALWTKLAWLAWFTGLKRNEPDQDLWVSLLEQPGRQTPRGTPVLAAAGRWSDGDLNAVLARFGLTLADLSSLRALRRVKDAMDFVVQTNLPAADLIAWTTDAPTAATIAAIKQALRARHGDLAWQTTLQTVNDALRNQRRDALVSYILHHQRPDRDIDTPDKLYEHFLIDVEMDACMKTSRIRAALSTVQQFVTRCLMNLEPDVAPSSIRSDHWVWIRSYRVWEAGRTIFLFPENFLDEEVRDNKSPSFREFESGLLQSDINDERAEAAYLSYLKKLDEVARLEIVGCCLQEREPGNQDDDILHVFGRSDPRTRQYYYRRCEYGHWTPWEMVSLNIEGDLIFPIVWRSQLFVFWLTTIQKTEGPDLNQTPEGMRDSPLADSARITVELNLAWGEYYQGKWTSPKSTNLVTPMRLTGLTEFEPGKVLLWARTEKPDGAGVPEHLVIDVGYPSWAKLFRVAFVTKHGPPTVEGRWDPEFLEIVDDFNRKLLWQPNRPRHEFNALRDESGKTFQVAIEQPPGAVVSAADETLLTKAAVLYPGFVVRPIRHAVENQWEAPLFYSDEHSVFFVEPIERSANLRAETGYFWFESPSLMPSPDAIRIPPLDEPPVVRDPPGPVPRPIPAGINPNYAWTIGDDSVFAYGGRAFDAQGLVKKGGLR